MKNITKWTAAFALLDFTNFANAQDTATDDYYYEWLRIDSADPTAITYSEDTITPSTGSFGDNVVNFQSVFSADKTWAIFGMKDNAENSSVISVLHEETLELEQITTTGAAISARQGHAVAACSSNVYVYGGMNNSDGWLGDFYSINSSDYTVTDLTSTDTPQARAYSTLSRYGDDYILFGGEDNAGNAFGELWKFTTADSTWSQLTSTTDVRSKHCATVLGDELYVFGDANSSDSAIHRYDFTADEWTTLNVELAPTDKCSMISSYEYGTSVDAGYIYMINQITYEITKVDVTDQTTEVVKAGADSAYIYGQSVLYEPDGFLTLSIDSSLALTINGFVVSPLWEPPADDPTNPDDSTNPDDTSNPDDSTNPDDTTNPDAVDEDEDGFFSSPAGIAVITAVGAAAVGAAVYFFVLKP